MKKCYKCSKCEQTTGQIGICMPKNEKVAIMGDCVHTKEFVDKSMVYSR